MTQFKDRLDQVLRDLKVPIGNCVTVGPDGADIISDIASRKILYQFICDCIPDRVTIVELQTALSSERNRRKQYEARVDLVRDEIERILCDIPTKNEMIRALEWLMTETSPTQDWSL